MSELLSGNGEAILLALKSGLRLHEGFEIAYFVESGDLVCCEPDAEGLLYSQNQPQIGKAIPTGDIVRCHPRFGGQVFILEDVLKDYGKFLIDVCRVDQVTSPGSAASSRHSVGSPRMISISPTFSTKKNDTSRLPNRTASTVMLAGTMLRPACSMAVTALSGDSAV